MKSTDTAVHVSAAGAGSWFSAEIFRSGGRVMARCSWPGPECTATGGSHNGDRRCAARGRTRGEPHRHQ